MGVKSITVPDEDLLNILEQLLQMKQIELPEFKRPKDMDKVDNPNYCKYYRIIGHLIQKCFFFQIKKARNLPKKTRLI